MPYGEIKKKQEIKRGREIFTERNETQKNGNLHAPEILGIISSMSWHAETFQAK